LKAVPHGTQDRGVFC